MKYYFPLAKNEKLPDLHHVTFVYFNSLHTKYAKTNTEANMSDDNPAE
jgi:hypothetical protein